MKILSVFIILNLLLLLNGCSSYSTTEPPAPSAVKVPPKKHAAKKPVAPPAPNNANKVPGTATYPLDNAPSNFKDEKNIPAIHAEPLIAPANTGQTPQTPQPSGISAAPISTPQPPGVTAAPITPPPKPATPPPIDIEDARLPSGTSPALVALVNESDRNVGKGDYLGAVVEMERALRIDSRNATVTYKLAQLRLKQSKNQQAEELAKKAATLAGKDLDLKRKSWLLIAEARHQQHDYQGAKEAKSKAESFFGH
jgi:hypothetical protein